MRRILRFLREPFSLLLMAPAAIAIGVGSISVPLLWIEHAWPDLAELLPSFSPDTARSVLTVIATAAMTALSLAYSLTLVVFTLAASAIGPRLLKRFTSDHVSQITAGAFAGCFLYALLALTFLPEQHRVSLTVLFGLFLAGHAVLQLIFFVHHVARSVSIDDEVADIAGRLNRALDAHRKRYTALSETPEDDAFATEVKCLRSGYIGVVDEADLVRLAAEHELVVRINERPGAFVLEGAPLALLSKPADDEVLAEIADMIDLDPSRSEGREIEFSIHLLVEIGLRALSPGVNDQYTAIAVSDAISGAVVDILSGEHKPSGLVDETGAPRLIVPGLSAKQLIGQAYHPLRRAGAGSILMSQALARAFGRLHAAAEHAADREMIAGHAALLLESLETEAHLPSDLESVVEFLPEALRDALDDESR